MTSLKVLLRKFDMFGVPMAFRYKTKEKYSTSLGGITIIIFGTLSLIFGVYYFIPFIKRKNFSIINILYNEYSTN